MKCPRCGNDVMMVLCRRERNSGFLNELYYKCLICGYSPERGYQPLQADTVSKKLAFPSKLKSKRLPLKFMAFAFAAIVGLAFILQVPVPMRVFATEISVEPFKDILPYISVVNFSISDFNLNYSEGDISLQIFAEYATLVSMEAEPNVTTYVVSMGKVMVSYQDSKRSFNMGFSNMGLTIKIMYKELIAKIDASTFTPLWMAIMQKLTGQPP